MASYEEVVVVIDANGVRSGRVSPNIEVLADEGFLVLNRIKMEINEAQAAALTSRDVEARDYLTGPVVALLLKRENAYDTILTVKSQLDDVYASSDTWSTLRDKTIFFPTKPQLERTVVIIKPEYTHDEYTEILETIEGNDFNIIGKLARILTPDIAKEILGDDQAVLDYCTNNLSVALVVEKIGAIDEWLLLMGPEDVDLAKDIAPNSLRAKYGKSTLQNALYGSESQIKAFKDLKLLFPAPFNMERTLAIIKPDAYKHSDKILQVIKDNGFEILAQSVFTLSTERAEQFFAEHKERSFYGELCKYMSSGPISVLCLGKPCAITAWKKILGPSDLSGGGLRARYGTDSVRDGFHASEDPEIATTEINFFFPQLSVEKIPNLLEVEDLLNRKPAPRPHVEPKKSLNDVLVEGLTQLCRIKPVGNDGIKWLGEWLLRNNPNKPNANVPVVEAPVEDVREQVSAAAGGEATSILWAVGGPGSGVEEHCADIVKTYGYEYVQVQEILEAAESSGNEYGELIKECKKNRTSVPAKVTVALIKSVLTSTKGKAKFLIHGFPKSLDEAFAFESEISPVDKILYFDCSRPTRENRVAATFGADAVEKLPAADKEFMETAYPVIDHFSAKSKVKKVSTDGKAEGISARIAKALR